MKDLTLRNFLKNNTADIFAVSDEEKNHAIVDRYLELWNTYRDSKMRAQEKSLDFVFLNYRQNDNFQCVLIKTAILNDFYSTNIKDTYSVAKVIFEMNIDLRLAQNDLTLVNEIAENTKTKCESKRREYSFASKYCSFHKPSSFPIFDSRNEMVLRFYKKELGLEKLNLRENYETYVETIEKYKDTFGLKKYSYKEIDRFNWTLCNTANDTLSSKINKEQ